MIRSLTLTKEGSHPLTSPNCIIAYMSRPASHAGSWYSASSTKLSHQIKSTFTTTTIPGTRIIIGPHAGYSYSSQRLGEAFGVLDLTKIKRIFILGPSHHVYFRNYAMVSDYAAYETPIGDVKVDVAVNKLLTKSSKFRVMDDDTDQDEHSFELHCPYIAYKIHQFKQQGGLHHDDYHDPKIIPIMISAMDEPSVNHIVDELYPFFQDDANAFVISSDFCHWGSRFNYTQYLPKDIDIDIFKNIDLKLNIDKFKHDIITISSISRVSTPIYKSIENLDNLAMSIATSANANNWHNYIKATGNTICGEKPMWIVLKLLERAGYQGGFKWLGYSQSNKVKNYFESSVSYASGYV